MLRHRLGLLLGLAAGAAFLRGASPVAAHSGGLADGQRPVAPRKDGRIRGAMFDPATQRPVEFVAVTLKAADGKVMQSAATDRRGRFIFEQVPAGNYVVAYGRVGGSVQLTPQLMVDSAHVQIDLGRLFPSAEVLQLEKFEVTAKQESRLNGIDRKVYQVGREIQSVTGSASDLLQNVPSVNVDIDGNVSLRGSDNVLILINGRTSTLMGASRAEVLQQLPADAIEKIEVITNPSAKYKPDGTAGIINIALKHQHEAGLSGTANFNVGNNQRYNAGFSINDHTGPYNLLGSFSVRQDDRPRTASDLRTITDPVTGMVTRAEKRTVENSRPFTRIGRLGWDFAPNVHDQFGLTGDYNYRSFIRRATDHNIVSDAGGVVTSDYDRARFDPEFERSLEAAATWQHTFLDAGHELKVEVKASVSKEGEPDHYTNTYRVPVRAPSYDEVLIHNLERSREAILEYVLPLADGSKFESGYDLTREHRDSDFLNAALDPASGLWVKDLVKSNRFLLDRTIHAFYATYARTFGSLALLAGVRPELATTSSHLVTTGLIIPNDYNRVYPSLHLTYAWSDRQEWQWNYSHRVHRPETEDLNPFPEYLDPFTLRAGNPHLQPEDIHSFETGYSYRRDDTSVTATAYYRYTYHGFTSVTTNLGNGVLLNTRENLAVNRATGLELTANTDVGRSVTLNLSTNTFFNTIDAANLGYSSSQSDVAWLAKAGVTLRLGPATQVQVNANYSSARLTPQGERRPTHVINLGVRHDLWGKKASLVLTVSDLFNSLKEENVINTPVLREDLVRRRSARII